MLRSKYLDDPVYHTFVDTLVLMIEAGKLGALDVLDGAQLAVKLVEQHSKENARRENGGDANTSNGA